MAHLAFDRLKTIDQRWKDLIFGYVHHRCQSLLPQDNAYYHIPEIVQFTILLFYYHRIKSSILTDTESDKLLSLFDSQNKFEKLEPFEYKLIYSSSKHGIGESIFKKICHNQANLLCFIQSKNGNVFGGYTKCGWNDSIHIQY